MMSVSHLSKSIMTRSEETKRIYWLVFEGVMTVGVGVGVGVGVDGGLGLKAY